MKDKQTAYSHYVNEMMIMNLNDTKIVSKINFTG